MTLTLKLKPEVESNLVGQAAREGIDPNTLALRTLEQQYGSTITDPAGSREDALLSQFAEGPSAETWRRYHELSAKRDLENLTQSEYADLIGLSENIEDIGSRRMELMAELAKLRGISFREACVQFGIPADNSEPGRADA